MSACRNMIGTRRRLAVAYLAFVILIVAAATLASRPEEAIEEIALKPLETRVAISLADVQGRRTGEGDLALHPGESVRVRALAPGKVSDMAWRLRLVGEVNVDRGLRSEMGFTYVFYRLIDDALDSQTTHHQTYSLLLRSNGELYPRRAYWRVFWDTAAEEREYPLKLWMKKEGLEILPGGRVGLEVAVYQQRPDRKPGDITGPPDAAYFLDAGKGTESWQERQLVE